MSASHHCEARGTRQLEAQLALLLRNLERIDAQINVLRTLSK